VPEYTKATESLVLRLSFTAVPNAMEMESEIANESGSAIANDSRAVRLSAVEMVSEIVGLKAVDMLSVVCSEAYSERVIASASVNASNTTSPSESWKLRLLWIESAAAVESERSLEIAIDLLAESLAPSESVNDLLTEADIESAVVNKSDNELLPVKDVAIESDTAALSAT